MQEVGLGDSAGAVRLLNVVNSLDTPDYGVLLEEWRLLQRAVFVIDPDGTVVHAEYVADQMTEPDYDAAVRAAAAAGAR
jgi:peroxiredoxin